jgi:hypothetical protein
MGGTGCKKTPGTVRSRFGRLLSGEPAAGLGIQQVLAAYRIQASCSTAQKWSRQQLSGPPLGQAPTESATTVAPYAPRHAMD